jgi:hypothetical protein
MSAQTLVYIYNPRQIVVLLEPDVAAGTSRRYEKVYSRTLTLNRGVDNVLEFQFINQNQKPVNITMPAGREIICRILTANETLIQKALLPVYPLTGIAKLELSVGELEDIQPQQCYYSLEIPVGQFDRPVFVDDNSGARGVVNIVNSVKPAFVPAQNITIPTHPLPGINANNNASVYYSSIINTTELDSLTVQAKFQGFTGNIQLQGSTLQDFAVYYNIGEKYEYTNSGNISNIAVLNSSGYFTCSATTDQLETGKSVTVTGTNTGTGSIVGYVPGSNARFFISSTNRANNFILSTEANGTPIATTQGTLTGLTMTINGYTGTDGYEITGYHPFVRMEIENQGTNLIGNAGALSGDVVEILSRTARPPLRP